MTATAPVLSVRELVKAYYGRSVLDGVDLDVGEHEVVVLIGAAYLARAKRRRGAAANADVR